MTYFGVLTVFILPPLALLLVAFSISEWRSQRQRRLRQETRPVDRRPYIAVGVHVLLALVYTTPWDNYLVATGVWWYDPNLVHGLRIGWVPIEEYTFFVVQTLFTGFWLLGLIRWWLPLKDPKSESTERGSRIRIAAAAVVVALWLAFTAVLIAGWQPGRYLALILAWALLPILLQVFFGADLLWLNRRLVVFGLLPTTLYLWLVDGFAIRSGTWTIDPAQTTGWMVGPLPVEEMVFFFVTNVLIVFGVTLFLAPGSRERLQQLIKWLPGNKPTGTEAQTQGAD